MKEIVLGLVSITAVGAGAYSQKPEVTYTQNIRPLIAAKCLPCHSKTANVGPFDFSTYESMTARIELIRNQILAQNMPPIWAHSDFGKLSLIEQFTDEEAVQLQEWIRNKMPMGPSLSTSSDTRFQKMMSRGNSDVLPSLTLKLARNSKVRSEGLPYWSVVSATLPAKGGQFKSIDLMPTNPRVIRYATLAIVPKDMVVPSETSANLNIPSKYLVGTWAPGYQSLSFPEDMSLKYGPNSKLIVHVHYRPTGKPEDASFQVDACVPLKKTTRESTWVTMEKKDVLIPAGKSEVVEITRVISKDTLLIAVLPEARFYAARVQLQLAPPGGKPKTVFDDMRWDPYWIGNYRFQNPITLPKGSVLTARFYYDNDEFCRINEGKKPTPIHAGPTSKDEVCRMNLLIGP